MRRSGSSHQAAAPVLALLVVAALLSQNIVMSSSVNINFQDQKTYYPHPDPHALTPPTGGHTTPTPTVPSHGGAPPANCGNPPSGGHHSSPTPKPPKSGGGGGSHHSPSPVTPTPTPVTPTPSTPSPVDPNSPPFTCTYWKTHPTLIWGFFGWFGTVGNAFGVSSSSSSPSPSLPSGFGAHMNLLEALSNTRTDGYGELYRQGTAALLNSVAHAKSFPYTPAQVKVSFVTALGSNKAAAAQAEVFKMANEGKIKSRA